MPLILYGSEVCCGVKTYGSMACNYACINETLACDVQLFTVLCKLEDKLNCRRSRFQGKLSNSNNDVIVYLRTNYK